MTDITTTIHEVLATGGGCSHPNYRAPECERVAAAIQTPDTPSTEALTPEALERDFIRVREYDGERWVSLADLAERAVRQDAADTSEWTMTCSSCGATYDKSDDARHQCQEAADTSALREALNLIDSVPDDYNPLLTVPQARQWVVAAKAVRAALRGATERPLDVEQAADDVRYAHGNGLSDYWRGYNDGIDKLAARLASPTTTTPETEVTDEATA